MNGGSYSELEFLILAMVGGGTSSGYAMRKRMNSWRGSRWSSESGSVYRVLRRLENDRLVHEARRVGVPNRERTEYELTQEGTETLKRWLTLIPERTEFGHLVDPIRTRAYFIERLPSVEQVRVIKAWIAHNKSFVEELEQDLVERPRGVVTDAVFANVVYLARARQEWLKKLLAIVRAQGKVHPGADEPIPTS